VHEVSIVRSLLKQVSEVVQPASVEEVVRIDVELGPLSGVEGLLVQQAFDNLRAAFEMPTAQLCIQAVPLTAVCCDCQAALEIQDFDFVCSACGSRAVQVTGGDAFRLLRIELAPGCVSAGTADTPMA